MPQAEVSLLHSIHTKLVNNIKIYHYLEDIKRTAHRCYFVPHCEGHSAHVLWKEYDLELPSEITFSIDIDEYFLTIRSTMLFYKFPNKTTIYLKLNQAILLIIEK